MTALNHSAPMELPSWDHLDGLVDTDPIELRNEAWQMRREVVRLKAERDKAVEDAQHMAGAMAKVGPALLEALRLAAAGDAAGAAAVLGDVAPEAPEEGGEVRG